MFLFRTLSVEGLLSEQTLSLALSTTDNKSYSESRSLTHYSHGRFNQLLI